MIIYTDGSSRSDGAGYGVIVLTDEGNLIECRAKQYEGGTNNEMELKAILWAAIKYGKFKPIIYTDSKYAIGCLQDWMPKWRDAGWVRYNGGEIKNLALIQAFSDLNFEGELRHVKGHANSWENTVVDGLATGRFSEEHVYQNFFNSSF